MAKRTNNRNDSSGLLTSILGMFNFNQYNICHSEDNSFYCNFMRFFQLFIAIIILCVIFYVLKLIFTSKVKLFGGKIRK